MRIGYSLTESEIVRADQVEYGDCAKFQIVCPECREAVFKGLRHHGDVSTHYLSHYRALSPEARDCEFRVESLARSLGIKEEAPTHGQTLHQFMMTFRASLVDAQAEAGILRADDMRRCARNAFTHSCFDRVAEAAAEIFRVDGNTRDQLGRQIAAIPFFSKKSEFWLRRQASYALDIMSHLRTLQGEGNRNWLAACAVALLARRKYNLGADHASQSVVNFCGALADNKPPHIARAFFAAIEEGRLQRAYEAGKSAARPDRIISPELVVRSVADPLAAVRAEFPKSGLDPKSEAALSLTLLNQKEGQLAAEHERVKFNLAKSKERLCILNLEIAIYDPMVSLLACVPLRANTNALCEAA